MGLTPRGARLGAALLVGTLAIGLVAWRWADVDPVSTRVEGALLDLRFRLRGPLPPPDSVVIVAVDEAALDRIGAYEPLREALTRALGTIAGAGPRVVALDVIMADRTDADTMLAAAIRSARPALLAVAATGAAGNPPRTDPAQEAALSRSAIPVVIGAAGLAAPAAPPALVLPNETLAGAGLLAHVNVVPEADGTVRSVPLSISVGEGRLLPSMALAAARFGLGAERGEFIGGDLYRIGGRMVQTRGGGLLVLDHYGASGRIPTIGLLDVLDGQAPPAVFAGRMVFIGSTAASLRDAFATPFGAAVPGVELQATAAANIVEGRAVRRDAIAFGGTALLALSAALLALAAFRLSRLRAALAAGVGCWLAVLAVLQAAFAGAGLWLDGIAVIGAVAVGSAVGGWSRLSRESRGRENLAHYVAPSLARQLAETAHPAFDGREHDVGILFVDVSGYSGLVETESPSAVATFLRQLHALFEDAAERHRGLVVDFQGDGALLVFGLPDPSGADAANALACAETLLAGRARVRAPFLTGPVRLRVSVHCGPVAVAVLGGRRHAQVSITGDAVNVTSRLQEFAKARDVPLVATRAALDAAGATHGLSPLGREPLRGRRGEIEIWGRADNSRAAAG